MLIPRAQILPDTDPAAQRILSVDALRGFDMFWIVGAEGIVDGLKRISNSGPIGFLSHQLEHKEWQGFAFEDLIFPLFVFLMGVAIVFSLGRIVATEGKEQAHTRLFRRFGLLFIVGIFYYGGFSHTWPNIRLVGVLQRIALCYLFGGLLFLNLKPRGLVVAFFILLIGYWALLNFIPVPGQPSVSFEPDKNLANYIDYAYLPGKLHNSTWDPEGLLSTIPAVASALLGVFAGLLLKDRTVPQMRKVRLLIANGIVLVILGFIWGLQFPVIKKIWTSSYVLVAGGYSAILLGLFYWLIDVRGHREWATPFFWIGANALTIYLASNLIDFEDIARRFVGGDIQRGLGIFGELVVSLASLGLVLLLAQFLYKRRIFLRL